MVKKNVAPKVIIATVIFLMILGVASFLIFTKDFKYGVAVHPSHYDTDVEMQSLHELGVTMAREDLAWHMIEREKGVYNFEESYGAAINRLIDNGIDPLIIIDYSNELYNNCPPGQPRCWVYVPTDPEDFELFKKAFGNYCFAAVDNYKGRAKYFEIWNEPYGFWEPRIVPDTYPSQAKQYTELAKECYKRGKEANKNAVFLAGGLGLTDTIMTQYIKIMFENGFAEAYDIFGIHPYCNYDQTLPLEDQGRNCRPIENIQNLKSLMNKYGGKTEMWITEFGYPTEGCVFNRNNPSDGWFWCPENLTEENQAIRMKNIFKTLKGIPEVTGFFWYDYKNDGAGRPPRRNFVLPGCEEYELSEKCWPYYEHRFGLVRDDNSKKPAWYEYQKIIGKNKSPPESETASFIDKDQGIYLAEDSWAERDQR